MARLLGLNHKIARPPRVREPGRRGKGSLLRIDQDAVVDEDDEVVLAVAGHVGHDGFARFGEIGAAAAEGALLEDLPAVGRDQLVAGVEDDEVEVVPGGFQEDQVLAAIVVQVAGDDVVEVAVLDGRFVAVEFGQVPDLAVERQAGDGVQAEEGDGVGLAGAEGDGLAGW